MNLRLWLAVLIALVSPAASAEDASLDAEALTGIYVKADESEYDYDSQSFRAEGNAFVRYNDISVTADRVTGNADTGDFDAAGNVTFTQGDRVVRGQSFTYNYQTKTGRSTDASASAEGVFFHGRELDSGPEGYRLAGSTFTTCDREEPHYYLAAKELIIRPKDKLVARRVRIMAFGETLLTLPKYTVSLKQGKPSKANLPSMGISSKWGPYVAHNLDVSTKPGLAGELAIRLSAREAFQGGIKLSETGGKPLAVNLTYREPYYGGWSPEATLSRLPEVAYRFYNRGTPVPTGNRNDSLYLTRTVLDPTRELTSHGRLHVVGEAGLGRFKEEPSGTDATRVDLRALACMDAIDLGGTLFMPGVLARVSHYDTGDTYLGLGFQFGAARKLSSNSYVSLTYVTHAIAGSTPFQFDPVEVPYELAGRFHFLMGSYAIELAARYDVQHSNMFDSEISISRPFHCLEPKLTWRNRFKEFSLGIGLVGF